jgi:hypothetical protein
MPPLNSDFAKLTGLIMTQVIGVASTGVLLGYTYSYAEIKTRHCWIGFSSLVILFAISCGVALFSPMSPCAFPEYFDLQLATRWFAALDLIVLSICVYITGGSEKSFAVPFLFIITPIILLIDKNFTSEALFTLIVAVIFYTILFEYYHELKIRIGKKPHHLKFTVLLAMVLCSIFPVIYVMVEKQTEVNDSPAKSSSPTSQPHH